MLPDGSEEGCPFEKRGDGAEGEDGQAGIPALQSDGKGGRTMV